jgi:hypothetical protein
LNHPGAFYMVQVVHMVIFLAQLQRKIFSSLVHVHHEEHICSSAPGRLRQKSDATVAV